ncbi:response regulator transcription factor [Pseudomonas sp. Gutcm_11s]|uniref:response regulator transcription factor n=1 Tax=Pseudomonas sp. Gutcm_11s TaxID=3026088 RepID=UPI00235F1087|nr:helix-turn-helix domain-containing protein [Pseudomonas sp. Gutcm_11s]MDD0843778.1 response regulator transcription factor [Pseudomonas sp. Gutcm_11s]
MKSNSATNNNQRKPVLLWLDLTHDRSAEELMEQFRLTCDCRLAKESGLPARDAGPQPDMLCMHFDRPDALGLNLLLEVKRTAPSIPITMFTVQHSEELAVWAMRSGVWEYLVLPLGSREQSRYLQSLQHLCQLRWQEDIHARKPQVERCGNLPDSIRLTKEHQKHQALHKAMSYIDQHYREGIDQKDLAQRCGMTPFRFSRLFKEAYGLGFMEYVLRKRMDLAKELLNNSQMPVTSIGYEAGFKDPSYFARAFKQCLGCTPSEYRDAGRPSLPQLASASLHEDHQVLRAHP